MAAAVTVEITSSEKLTEVSGMGGTMVMSPPTVGNGHGGWLMHPMTGSGSKEKSRGAVPGLHSIRFAFLVWSLDVGWMRPVVAIVGWSAVA